MSETIAESTPEEPPGFIVKRQFKAVTYYMSELYYTLDGCRVFERTFTFKGVRCRVVGVEKDESLRFPEIEFNLMEI